MNTAPKSDAPTVEQTEKPSVKERFWEEMRKFGLVAAYLYVCFVVLVLYKSAILAEQGTSYLPYGVALVKALVIGKFILIGDAIKFGTRNLGSTLLHRVAQRTLAMFFILLIFTAIEEWLVGLYHGETIAQTLGEYFSRSWVENLAPDFLILLILIPLMTAAELRKTIGAEQFKAHFLKPSGPGNDSAPRP
jgi:hypothetical protein